MARALSEQSYSVFSASFESRLGEIAASRLARWVYLGVGAFLALLAGSLVLLAFRASAIWGMAALALGAVVVPLLAALMRLGLELVVAAFRIADLAAEIAEQAAEISVNTAGPGEATERVGTHRGERL